MLKIDLSAKKERRVMYPVTVQLVADGGEPAPVTFSMGFVLMDRPAYQAWFRRDFSAEAQPDKKAEDESEGFESLLLNMRNALSEEGLAKRDAEIRKHCYAWELADMDGKPLPFNDKNLTALMNQGTTWAIAIENAWLDACQDAPVKND